MKKWTVMLIPHDRGNTQTLTLSHTHFYCSAGLLVALTFLAGFFYQRQEAFHRKNDLLKETKRSLELELAKRPENAPQEKLSQKEARDIEAKVRAEHDASMNKILSELSALYDVEAKARTIVELPPRKEQAEVKSAATKGGRGGQPNDPMPFSGSPLGNRMHVPNLIYGMSHPSADLVLQEIRLRTHSFQELVADLDARHDVVDRKPTLWPLINNLGEITSGFGYRIDPFNMHVRHHDGTDIGAPYGTPVLATAKGKVIASEWDHDLGNVVKIDHGNGLQTWYGHMSERMVTAGQLVEKQQQVGKLGSTGRSTGPHLHYQVLVNGTTVDAEQYLND